MIDILNTNNLLTNLKILKIQNKSNFTPNKLNPNQNPALEFLQGQLTIDINNLEDDQLSLAAHCNPKGRVESLFYILKTNDSYYLIMPEDIIDHAKNKLIFFGRFSPITFEIISPEISLILNNNKNIKYIYNITNSKILNISLSINWETNLDNSTPKENVNKNADILWQYHQIINNIPYLNKQTIGKYLPEELGLTIIDSSTIDFKKGCFTGQEVIARMHYLGKSKKEIKYIKFNSPKEILPETLYKFHGKKIKDKIGELICITKNIENQNYLAAAIINKTDLNKIEIEKENNISIICT